MIKFCLVVFYIFIYFLIRRINSFPCNKTICQKITCSETFKKENGFGIGGCCSRCLPISRMEDRCNKTKYFDGKKCFDVSSSSIMSRCISQRIRRTFLSNKRFCILKNDTKFYTGLRFASENEMMLPKCDGRLFSSRQCHGERLFGYMTIANSSNNSCACSLAQLKRNSSSHLLCSNDGNYMSLQCLANNCFCANSLTGVPLSEIVTMNNIATLPCFENEYRKKLALYCNVTNIFHEGKQKKEKMCYCFDGYSKRAWKVKHTDVNKCYDKNLIVGLPLPECFIKWLNMIKISQYLYYKGVHIAPLIPFCNLDGSFSCNNNYVNTDNSQYKQLLISLAETEDKDKAYNFESFKEFNDFTFDMKYSLPCQCANEKSIIENEFVCDKYGNYKVFQCIDGKCFCIDQYATPISAFQSPLYNWEYLCREMRRAINDDKVDPTC